MAEENLNQHHRQDNELEIKPQLFESLVQSIFDGLVVLDENGVILETNPAFCEMIGYTRDALLGLKPPYPFMRRKSLNILLEGFKKALLDQYEQIELVFIRKNGEEFPCLINPTPMQGAESKRYVVTLRDVSAEHRMVETLRSSEERLRKIIDLVPHFIFIRSLEGRFLLVNQAMADIYRMKKEDLVNQRIIDVHKDPKRAAALMRQDRKVVESGKPLFIPDDIFYDAAGNEIYCQTYKTPFVIPDSSEVAVLCVAVNVTEQKKVESELNHLATHDPLTDLPNRLLFNDRLNYVIAQARRKGERVAVLLMDLDDFKAVNDAFSYADGDLLIRAVGSRVLDQLRGSDTVARMGGDEYAVLLSGIQHEEDVAVVAQKILDALSEPFFIQRNEVFISTSIGISIFPDHDESVEALLQLAEIALYRAKQLGKNTFQTYSEEMAAKSLERVSILGYLHHALERDEMVLHYQPIVNIGTGEIIGAEALLRWRHPDKGLIMPDVFIPLAEESGMINELGEWVLRQACQQAKAWLDAGLTVGNVGVNISQRQFKLGNLPGLVAKVLEETGLPPRHLSLEMTENIVFQEMQDPHQQLLKLRDVGIRLAIDDFGSGFSTLKQLAHLPFHVLKLDRSFADLSTRARDNIIVEGIVGIGNGLGLQVIAEGIETTEQLEFFEAHGCTNIQGWYFSKAVPVDVMTDILRQGFRYFQKKDA